MIAALLLTLQGATMPSPGNPPVPVTTVPPLADWPSLPAYPLPREAMVPDASAYVRSEVEAGHCAVPIPPPADGARIVAPVAILVGPGGAIRRMVPRAIGCPTVEQFTVGYILSLTRGIDGPARRLPPGWYRAGMSYRW